MGRVFFFSAAKAAIHIPSVEIDLLIFLASSNLRPSELDFESLSLPAKSMRDNTLFLTCFYFC